MAADLAADLEEAQAEGASAEEVLGSGGRDFFDEHIKPELRIIRRGSKTILIPVVELERWVDHSEARWST
jgi:hypothetical protein